MPLNRPPTLCVRVLTNDLVEVYNWEALGTNLGIKKYKLQEIKKNRMDDTPLCKLDLFDLWLRSDITASWKKLIKAVETLGEYETLVVTLNEKYLGIRTTVHETPAGASVIVTGGNVVGQIDQGRLVTPQQESAMDVDDRYRVFHSMEEIITTRPADEVGSDSNMLKIVKMILDENMDVNMIPKDDEYKRSLLQRAAQTGDINFVKVLAAFGAKVNYKNANSMTAMDIALTNGHADVQELLRKMGGLPGVGLTSTKSSPIEMDDMEMDTRESESHHVLTLDSSGPMALVQLEILNQIEEETEKEVRDTFEWIVASGVGGFLLLAMLYTKKKTIRELRLLYFKLWQRLFKDQGDTTIKKRELERFAVEVFTNKTRMCDEEEHKVMIAAVNRDSTQLKLEFFNNFLDEDSARIHVWKVACYTCATSYFGAADNYIHGGAITKNLSDIALTRIDEYRSVIKTPAITGVVSIGDGVRSARPFTDQTDLSMCAVNALAELAHENCKCRCKSSRSNLFYHRLNPLFPDATPESLRLEDLIDLAVLTIIGMREKKNDSSDTELDVVGIDLNN